MDNLVFWICLGLPLSKKNVISTLEFDTKIMRLGQLFTEIYQQIILNNIVLKTPEDEKIDIGVYFLSIFEPVSQFLKHKYRKV